MSHHASSLLGGNGRVRREDEAQKADFASLLSQMTGSAASMTNPLFASPPLDGEGLIRIVQVLKRMMDLRALALIAGEGEGVAPMPTMAWHPVLPVQGGDVPSNYRQVVPKNESSSGGFAPFIREASLAHGVPERLIRAVIRRESNFNPLSTSPKGAMGLMQLMPETARELGVRDPYDPRENIMAGTRYLRLLLDRYGGRVPLALAAYNWGMGNLERHPERLPRETREYVLAVMKDHLGAGA